MKLLFSTLIFTCCIFSCFAQKEASNWFFVQNAVSITPAGVNMAVSQPDWANFRPGVSNTSVADTAGNLLFACGGNTIIDKDFAVMPALTNVDFHADEGISLAQKIPGTSQYLVFYNQSNQPSYLGTNLNWTLKYAIVDMSLNAGKGDVLVYDQIIDTALSTGYTLVQGNNTENAWLVTHRANTDTFLNYRITASGLSTSPVICKAGSIPRKTDYIFKNLRASHDGSMIAGLSFKTVLEFFTSFYQYLEVFNFDVSTGQLATKVRTSHIGNYYNFYVGMDFSPDNRLLYLGQNVSSYGLQPCDFSSSAIFQYNLCYTDTTEFTRFAPGVGGNFVWCASGVTLGRLQTGPDKKVHSPFSGVVVATVNNPNRIGTSANFVMDSYQLPLLNNGYKSTTSFQHRQLEKAIKNNIVYQGGCHPNPTRFSVTNDTITKVEWNFGDPLGVNNIVTQQTPVHLFSGAGKYLVTAKLYNSLDILIETLTELVEIKDPTKRLLAAYPRDTSICHGESFKVKLDVVNGIFVWYTKGWYGEKLFNQVSDSNILSPGTWYVEMRQNDCDGCIMIDSITVIELVKPDFNLGYDRSLCRGDTLRLRAYDTTVTYIWSTGDTSIGINVVTPGIYWLEGEYNNNGCITRDSILLTDAPSVRFSLPADTTLCNDNPLLLAPGVSTGNYLWQDFSRDSTFLVTQSGLYWVDVYSADFSCIHTDSIAVQYVNASQVFLGNDTSVCKGTSVVLQPNISGVQNLWNDNSTGTQLIAATTGSYWIRVNNGSCTVTDTIYLQFNEPPIVYLGADTSLCTQQSLPLSVSIDSAGFQWQDGSGNSNFTVNGPGVYWLQVRRNACTVSDSIVVNYYAPERINLGADVQRCAGTDTTIIATGNFVQYNWNNGTTGPAIRLTTPGEYIVTATTINGCTAKDTIAMLQPIALPVVQLNHSRVICTGQSRTLDAGPGFATYLWNDGSSLPTRAVSSTGFYSVTVTSQQGCVGSDSVNISMLAPLPAGFMPPDTAMCPYETMQIQSLQNYPQYLWNTNATTRAITVANAGKYILTVTDQNGCRATDSITIAAKDCMLGLFAPAAFTPANGGGNNYFRPLLFGNIGAYDFSVYNRFGQLLFRSANPLSGWDGYYKNEPQPAGAYVWICRYQLNGSAVQIAKGTVLLLR